MKRRAGGRKVSDRRQGLTLIEMMIVLSIILILLGAAIPIYSHSIRRAREANLRRNLETLNQAIYQYAMDKQKAPESLDDLHAAGYIDKVPADIDGADWVPEEADAMLSLEQTGTEGIIGVHSGSDEIGSDGRPYSEW
jgi:general secretion pathway protein G